MQRFSTDEVCRAFLERVRWPDGPVCPKCGSVGRGSRVASRPGTWNCCVGACKAQFSATAGTPFHRTRAPLAKWFLAIRRIAETSDGLTGQRLADELDVDYRTAWYMRQRVRQLMDDPDWRPLVREIAACG